MSASFHMAQRTGVILSGDYSAPELKGITTWPEGSHGILEDGSILRKAKSGYEYWQSPEYRKETLTDYTTNIPLVGYRWKYADALPLAKERYKSFFAPQTSSSASTLTVKPGTWNDGAYTYVVKSPSEVFVKETGVTFKSPDTPSAEKWDRVVKQLNSAKLTAGDAAKKASGGGGGYAPSTVAAPVTTPVVSTPFYKAKWFLPAVGVATLGVVLLIALWPSKKKDAAPVVYLPTPPPVPVPTPQGV